MSAPYGFPTLRRCAACGRLRFYPKPICPFCRSPEAEPAETRGKGTLYSFTVVHRPPTHELRAEAPYVVALVDLDEGVRVTGRILVGPAEEPRVGGRVELVAGDPAYALFRLIERDDAAE